VSYFVIRLRRARTPQVLFCAFRSSNHTHSNADPSAKSGKVSRFSGSLFPSKNEIIKKSDAVGLRPDADTAGTVKRFVLDFEQPFAVEEHREEFAGKFDAQRAPLAARHLRVHSVAKYSALHRKR